MQSVSMPVRGKSRNVLLENRLDTPNCGLIAGQWRARVNVGKKTVSGTFIQYKSGIRRFQPLQNGINNRYL